MTLSIHATAIGTFVPMLRSLSAILDKGAEHAGAKKFDVAVLVRARLAPDMYPLATQVQLACYNARDAAARLAGQPSSRPEIREETFDELKARIAGTIEDLQRAPEPALEGAEDRAIEIPVDEERAFHMTGAQFLIEWALPHFYFHVVTAYDILRNHGVDIGKRDYVRNVGRYLRPRGEPA